MLHACVQKFDVTDTVQIFLGVFGHLNRPLAYILCQITTTARSFQLIGLIFRMLLGAFLSMPITKESNSCVVASFSHHFVKFLIVPMVDISLVAMYGIGN
jgi:hypothetical protein